MWKDRRMCFVLFFSSRVVVLGEWPPDQHQRQHPLALGRYTINIISLGHKIRSRIYIPLNFFLLCVFSSFSKKVSEINISK